MHARLAGSPQLYHYAALILFLSAALIATLQNYFLPPAFVFDGNLYTNYNNFVIFRQSFGHLLEGKDLYVKHLSEHGDYFKYSPTFALLAAPLYYLPLAPGLAIWNISGSLLLLLGLRTLVPHPRTLFVISLALLPELYTSLTNSQSNIHIAGLLLLMLQALQQGKNVWPAILLMLTVYIKLFTLVMLPLFLLFGKKRRKGFALVACVLIFALLPVFITGFDGLVWQYQNWFRLLREDHDASAGQGMYGLVSAFTGTTPNKLLFLMGGGLLVILPLLRRNRFNERRFQILYFALLLLWQVLFNHKAESPTYIIALTGIVAAIVAQNYGKTALLLGAATVLLTSLSVSDLVPREIRKHVVEPYCIKALLPSVILFWVLALLLRRQRETGTNLSQP